MTKGFSAKSRLPVFLELAADARSEHLYYVSTAYAAGMREGICMETTLTTDSFNNVYGHSKTGTALNFKALYYPVKSLLYILDIFVKDIVEQAGKWSKQWRVYATWDSPDKKPNLNPAEQLFHKFIEQYRPYLSDRRIFDRSRTESITPDLSAAPFTYDIFERCMTYAVSCDWGKNNKLEPTHE